MNAMPRTEKPPPEDGLTHDDVLWIREQRKQDAHAQWLRGQIRVVYPWVISVVGAIVAATLWIKDHVRF